jgi:hypothetical protein
MKTRQIDLAHLRYTAQNPGFKPMLVHVQCIMDKEAMAESFVGIRRFFHVIIIPLIFYAHSFICHRRNIILKIDSIIK